MPENPKKVKFELTVKEIRLIKFIRNDLPFGKCCLITHNGEPQRVEDIRKMKIFGDALDKNNNNLDKYFSEN